MLKLYNGKAYDFEKEPSDTIQNAYDAKVEFDKGYMLTFKVIVDDKGLHKKIREEMIVVCKGGYKNKENAFRIKERLEFGTYVEFKCPHIFYDLDHKRTKVPSGLFTANDILDFIQQNTEDISDFKFKHDYIYGDAKLEFGNYKELRDKKDGEKVEPKVEYYNTLELMNKVFNEYDCEFMFDFWTINVYNKLGKDKESLIYEYKNIEDWEGIHSMEGKATRVIALSDFERTTTYKTKYPNQKLYIHFAYANDNKGKDFTNTNYQSRKYIGYYVDTKYQNSPNAKDYKWVSMKIPRKTKKKPAFKGDRKVKGITSFMVGTDYRDGIPIKLNKKTFYLHTAFANYLDGKDININDGKGAKYVGFMIDDKKDNTRVKEWFTFNHLTEKGGLLINDRRTLKEKVHLETVVDSPLVNDYAQIYHDTYINNDARTVDELSQDVLDLFDEGWDKPRRTIKCKVKLTNNDRHRLTTLGDYLYYGDNEPCDIYDTVILRYITHNVDERIKCIGFEYDPINENLEVLKFGSKEKNDTISSSVTSGVKANIEQKQTEFDRRWKEINDYYDEELRKGREEFNHIWLSEKIDFINGFNEYGEYVEDIQSELDRIDAEKKQKEEELTKRLEENDKLINATKENLITTTNQAINTATQEINRIDKEIVTINNNVVDLNKTKADIKEVYTKKDVDFKVDELNNSITSEVTKTVYSKVNSSINSQEYINKIKGANGSNFTWNLLKKSNEKVENSNYLIAKYDLAEKPIVDENYTCTIWGKLSEDKDDFKIFNSGGWILLGHLKKIGENIYQVIFKWRDKIIDQGTERIADNSHVRVYAFPSSSKSLSRIDKIKLEKGTNTNPVWSPCVDEIKGDKGEQGIRGLQGKDGRDGIAGKDGVSSFTHIAYSNSIDGSKDFSTNNPNREYIGIYVDSNKTDSGDYKSYKWSKIKGLDGKNGIAGKAGADGKTPYLHIAYSNSQDGSKDFSINDSNRDYIGQYTDFSKADSTDYKKYSWSKIKGEFEGEIGGRNYLLKSERKISNDGYLLARYELAEKPTVGETYTCTIWGNLGEGKTIFWVYHSSGYVYLGSAKKIKNGIYQTTFKWADYRKLADGEEYTANDFKLSIYAYPKHVNGVTSTIDRIKLEKSTTGTDWSPAPEDFANELGLARDEFKSFKEETEKHFLQTVSLDKYNQFNQLYQKEQSELKQTVNSLGSKITKTQNDLKQYSNLSQKVDSMSSTVAQIEPLKLSHAKLEQKVNSFSSNLVEISNNTKKISSLTQTVNGLSSTVSSLSNGLDSKIGSIIDQKKSSIVLGIGNITGLQKNLDSLQSSITVNKKSITAKADKIDLVGKVSFSDLNYENKGRDSYTFIDGGRIITDTITSLQIQAEAIMSSHLYVSKAMITKLNTENLLAKEILADNIFAKYIETFDISANRIKTGIISSENGVSRIDLEHGTFNFYNGSLTIDETYLDKSSNTYRARLHTQSTFRVSYAGRPKVELNSGGIVFFHDGSGQKTPPCGQIRGNAQGRLEILATGIKEDIVVKRVEIGTSDKNGFVMKVYGSLRVQGNLQVDQSIKYGGYEKEASISKGYYKDSTS